MHNREREPSIDWNLIDDYIFVRLVGDLLVRLGFVDVDFQGAGPDGGVDLFATELVPFAVPGRIPFRWAVQCKFSKKGNRASVREAEVRDIEGLLRSDRNQAQRLQGYLLISNRRISNNVVERLRGIDRSSHFKTAIIDGAGIEDLLKQHDVLVDRYFGWTKSGDAHRRPSVISPMSSADGLPTLRLELGVVGSRPLKVSAIVDTGFTGDVFVPSGFFGPAAKISATTHLQLVDGSRVAAVVYRCKLRFVGTRITTSVLALSADGKDILIGMGVLRRFNTILGPDGTVVLTPKQ